jgi:P-type Cu2+ transporter
MQSLACFHCGEPVPPGSHLHAVIDRAERPMCCAGCAAVAQTIADHGLGAYYSSRSMLPQREVAVSEMPRELGVYDIAEVQQPFVRELEDGIRQATLLVEGITCGACAWLIERRLQQCGGVRSAAVNLSARRVQVEWDSGRARLSTIMQAVNELGYRAQGFEPSASASAAMRERRRMLWRLFVAGLGMMQVMMYAVPVYVAGDEIAPDAGQIMRWASFFLTVPVVFWSAGPFFVNAWRELRAWRVGMDVPVSLGVAVAFAASAWGTWTGSGEVYFDSVTMFVFLLLGARYLESMARARSADSQQRLVHRMPPVADRLLPNGAPGSTERVAAARLAVGDLILVAPGSTIPADGKVVAGRSAADESLLTGESRPVVKQAGAAVIGGSVNIESPLTVEVTRAGPATMLAGIVRLMDRAQSDRPRIAQAADRVARWFVSVLLLVALATGLAWSWIDPGRALWVMVAVLVVSCPCALSLATPAALAAATGALHRRGILNTRGYALETLAKVTHVVFDKTGTLTAGRLSLVGVIALGTRDQSDCLSLAAALEQGSEHPIARALRSAATCIQPVPIDEVRNHPGGGIEGRVGGKRLRVGNPAFVSGLLQGRAPAELVFAADDVSVAALADEDGYIALFTFADALKPGSRWLVQELQARGKTVCLLSGDRRPLVSHVAAALGIGNVLAEAGPAAKLAFIRELQRQGGVVAMVGDGINDAPVLAGANVSIATGEGTDLAHACADMVLLAGDIDGLAAAFDTARDAMRIIRQNLSWAALYNLLAIPLAVAGWITPLLAGVGMAASSLAVVANALRLQDAGPRPEPPPSATRPAGHQALGTY